MGGLERLQVLAGGDVMLLGLVRRLVALGDVRPDRADKRRLRLGGGAIMFGIVLLAQNVLPSPAIASGGGWVFVGVGSFGRPLPAAGAELRGGGGAGGGIRAADQHLL